MRASDTSSSSSARAIALARPRLLSVWVLTLSLLAFAAFGWLSVAPRLTPLAASPWPWWFFLGTFVVGKYIRVELTSARAQSITLVMTDAALVVALLLAEPRMIPIGIVAASISSSLLRRSPIIKVAFNVSQELAGAFIGLLAFELIRDQQLVSARSGIAALAGGITIGLFSQQAVTAVTRLAGGNRQQTPIHSLAVSSVGSIGNGVVALQAVYFGSISLVLTVIPVVFIAVLYLGYRSIRSQQQTTDRTELLYRTTSALHEQPNMDEGLLRVLDEARQALRSKSARIVLLTADGAATCAASGDAPSAMTTATATEEAAAKRLASELPGAALLRTGTPAVTGGPASVFASEDTIIAPIVRGGEPAGIVIVSGRSGGADQLGQPDVDLVELLAKQVGLALEKGFLERSLRQLLELEQQLTRQAYYDAVTGLANRNYLNEELERLAARADQGLGAVLLVDLDDFKTVNDSLGHVAGDQLLAVVAQRLLHAIGTSGLVARVGGDEFAVVLPMIETDDDALALADDIIRSVAKLVSIEGRELGIGASVGIRMTGGAPVQEVDLLRDADLALYNAKSNGKGQATMFVPAMYAQAQERLTLTTALASAVERDEFALVFQPIVHLDSGRMAGVEALVRWRHPERGEIGPAQFLGLTEESGLIVLLGRNVLRQALTALSGWLPALGESDFYISVNVSARQLREDDFAESVLELLRQFQISPKRLVLEITESMLIDDVLRTKQVLDHLAAVGVRISLDDFGTGYSSLSQIQQLPFHQIKIDQSFVRRLGSGKDAAVVVRAILQLADAMHLDAVAEGIELQSHLADLRVLGCSKGQGWLFSKAMPSEQINEMLLESRRSAHRKAIEPGPVAERTPAIA